MDNKRGLSEVVTIVILVLLIMIAVVILWSFVRPETQEVSEEVVSVSSCVQINLEALSCEINPNASPPPLAVNCPDIAYNDGIVGVPDLICPDGIFCHFGACPALPEPCPWDITDDNIVDNFDFILLLCYWGDINCQTYDKTKCPGDVDNDGDGVVDTCDSDDDNPKKCGILSYPPGCLNGFDMPIDDPDGDGTADGCDDCRSGTYDPNNDLCDENDFVRVGFKRNVGGGIVEGVKLIFGFDIGSKVIEFDSRISELQVQSNDTRIIGGLGGQKPISVDLAPVLKDGYLCAKTSVPIQCE